MTRTLKAQKTKDGWLVTITETHIVGSETDVRNMARYNGLKVKRSDKNTIYAE